MFARPVKPDSELLTVATLEAMVRKAVADRPSAAVGTLWEEQQEAWLRQLPDKLGERKLRLLLAACCRDALRASGNLQREILEALAALEQFADTGKSKTSLRNAQSLLGLGAGELPPHLLLRPGVREVNALRLALSATEPQAALVPVWVALAVGHNISKAEALERFKMYHGDLVAPGNVDSQFQAAWRTPAVVALARQMYESGDFSAMLQLTNLLEQAGCHEQAILEHCRATTATHVRGCWVVDAILDGNWPRPPKAEKTKAKTLLSSLPKRTQLEILGALDLPNARLPLEEYFAQQWDLERHYRALGGDDAQLARDLSDWSSMHPEWNAEQVRVSWAIARLTLVDAFARRIEADDPAEFGRWSALGNRVLWYQRMLVRGADTCDLVWSAFAIRDVAFALRVAQTSPRVRAQEWSDFFCQAVTALVRKDDAWLRESIVAMQKGKQVLPRRHLESCLKAMVEQNAAQVKESIQALLEVERGSRHKAGYGVLYLDAHSLYRLAEWVSPDLVQGFDVTQAFPWDAPFHAWSESHSNPLEGIDLSRSAPLLHELLVELRVPNWWLPASPRL